MVEYQQLKKSKKILAAVIVLVIIQLALMLVTKKMLDQARSLKGPSNRGEISIQAKENPKTISFSNEKSVSGASAVMMKSSPKGVFVFNFDSQQATPVLGGDLFLIKKTPNSSTGDISVGYDESARLGAEGKGMRVKYEFRSASDSENWLAVDFNVSGVDINDKSELVFWIKGDVRTGYNPSLKVRLSDGNQFVETELPALGQFWKRISIPLSEYKGKINIQKFNSFRLIIPISKEAKLNKGAYNIDRIEIS